MWGLTTIAVSLILLFSQQALGDNRSSVEARETGPYQGIVEYTAIGMALREGAEREVVAKRFLTLADTYPNTDRAKEVRELAVLLQQMAEEDGRFRAPPDVGSLSQEQQISLHIYRLRDVPACCTFTTGKTEVIRDWPDPNSAAIALRKTGKPAVPALIDVLGDRRPTRSIDTARNGGYVLRYNDAALQILQSLTGRRFTDGKSLPPELKGRGRYFSNYPDMWQERIRLEIRRWWETNKDKDESRWLRESLSQSGVGALWYTLDLAERLVQLEGRQAVGFLRERLRAEPDNSFVVSLLAKAGGKEVVEDIRLKIHHEDAQVRAAAYQALLDAGETHVVDMVIADLAQVLKNPGRKRYEHDPLLYVLAKADSEKAVLAAARAIRHPDPKVARGALVTFEGILSRAGKPAPPLRRIVVPYMAAAALDAQESSGFAVSWLVKAGYIDIGPVQGAQPQGDQDSARNKIRAWWQAHRAEYPEAQAWDASV